MDAPPSYKNTLSLRLAQRFHMNRQHLEGIQPPIGIFKHHTYLHVASLFPSPAHATCPHSIHLGTYHLKGSQLYQKV